jgi:uncharacterized damage-inducible protein DinB
MSNKFEAALGVPKARYNPVMAAYDGMNEDNRRAFRHVIQDEAYSHAQVAAALREIGYEVDRKQVQAFREKLSLGKVEL